MHQHSSISKFMNYHDVHQALDGLEYMHMKALPLLQDTLYNLLQASIEKKDLASGRRLHSLVISNEPGLPTVLQDRLARVFGLCGSLLEANLVFCQIPKPNVHAWYAIISAHALHHEWEMILKLYVHMQLGHVHPSRDIMLLGLKACDSLGFIMPGRVIHGQLIVEGFLMDAICGSILISMYMNCANISEAHKIFDGLKAEGVTIWCTMISGYLQRGQCLSALELFEVMVCTGVKPDKFIYPCILKACGCLSILVQGRLIHESIIKSGFESDTVIGSAIIDMYCKCGSLDEARQVFQQLPIKNTVTWGAMIAGYGQHGYGLSSFEIFKQMEAEGIQPNRVTFLSMLDACGKVGSLRQGRLIHDNILRNGLESDVVVGNTLIDMYAKGKSLEEAQTVFAALEGRNVVSWCAIIAGYMQDGQCFHVLELFKKMRNDNVVPNHFIFACILKVCGKIGNSKQGMLIHDQIIRTNFDTDVVIGSSLIDLYAQCGCLDDARKLFDTLQNKNVVSWDVMIGGYAQQGLGRLALDLFDEMKSLGLKPNEAIYVNLIKACGDEIASWEGRFLHEEVVESGAEKEILIGSSLIDMYAKFGSLDEAFTVFDQLMNKSVFSWSAIIRAYTYSGYSLQAHDLFVRMMEDGIAPDEVTLLCALKTSGSLGALEEGRLLHHDIIMASLEVDTIIGNSLIDMYSNCGALEDSYRVFKTLPSCDASSWSTMIKGYALHSHFVTALGLFEAMRQEDIIPDQTTLLCVLKACGSIGASEKGKWIHDQIRCNKLDSNVIIGNALIEMYINCGCLEGAGKVFDDMPVRDIVSWGTMIAGYAKHDMPTVAWHYLEKMQREGLKPDHTMYTSILSSCTRTGKIQDGCKYFRFMIEDHGIEPTTEHINCMVYLFAHAGCLKEAAHLLESMPVQPDVSGWMSLLSACKMHGDLGLGRQSFHQMCQMNENFSAVSSFMVDICTDANCLDDAHTIQDFRHCSQAWGKPGKAWIEVECSVHEFIVGDQTHSHQNDIQLKLKNSIGVLKQNGHVPLSDRLALSTLKDDYDSLKDLETKPIKGHHHGYNYVKNIINQHVTVDQVEFATTRRCYDGVSAVNNSLSNHTNLNGPLCFLVSKRSMHSSLSTTFMMFNLHLAIYSTLMDLSFYYGL